MGNEEQGISDKMRQLADETFYMPMCGFAESSAITLAYMCAASGRGPGGGGEENERGPLRPGDLDPHEVECLKLKGMLNSLAQKRMGKALLKKGESEFLIRSSVFNIFSMECDMSRFAEGIVLSNALYI
jgi:hypothetical protein